MKGEGLGNLVIGSYWFTCQSLKFSRGCSVNLPCHLAQLQLLGEGERCGARSLLLLLAPIAATRP